MPTLRCSCGKTLQVADELAGRMVKCPACRTTTFVPSPSAQESSGSDLESLARMEQEMESVSRPHRRSGRGAAGTGAPGSVSRAPDPPTRHGADLAMLGPGGRPRSRGPRKPSAATWGDILRCTVHPDIITPAVELTVRTLIAVVLGAVVIFALSFTLWGNAIPFVMPFLLAAAWGFFFQTYRDVCEYWAGGGSYGDSGDLFDHFLDALVIFFFAFVPAILLFNFGAGQVAEAKGVDDFLGLAGVGWPWLVLGIFWINFYAPMGIAVAAVKKSINPVTVVRWAFRCIPDYLLYMGVAFVFRATVTVIAVLLLLALASADKIVAIIVAVLTWLLISQYLVIAEMAMVGLILRRNEAKVGWFRDWAQSRTPGA